jgi:hypothetical protein
MSTDSRTVEKLIALLRYEMSPEAEGCSAPETLEHLLDWVKDVTLNPETESDADLTDEQLDRCNADARIVADHLIMALAACGRLGDAESFVEGWAQSRRECAARSKVAA